MKNLFKCTVILVVLACSLQQAWANGLVISNASRPVGQSNVTFNISWQNSWRVGGSPANHDAVWVFVKIRPCGTSGTWGHALLDTIMTNHTFSSGITYARPVDKVNRLGTTAGGPHNTGILIRRASFGTGHIVNETATLRIIGVNKPTSASWIWDPNQEYDIRVFGIEMVQIPQGGFTLGDACSYNSFRISTSDPSPVPVGNEFYTINLAHPTYSNSYVYSLSLPTNYPKGFNEIYCMKYEVTQGQYADFLNTVDGSVMGVNNISSHNGQDRLSLYLGTGGFFVSNHPDRACNWLTARDLYTYLDWAALRPMTEFEFEKICKGSGHQPCGFAWGSTSWVRVDSISLGTEDGTEVALDYGANINAHTMSGSPCNGQNHIVGGVANNFTTCQGGPVGAGIFARDNTLTREQTGATYWGVMEMSGNVREWTVSVHTSDHQNYTGIWGDGIPNSTTGRYDVPNWPANPNNGYRGGAWSDVIDGARVCNREYIDNFYWNGTYHNSRQGWMGGRGVR